MSGNSSAKKLTLISLVLMIFTSVYGFANMPRAFFLMGYGAIPWYILGAITFFLPYAFMMAEYGAAFKSSSGGIFSWMKESVNAKYAFIGTFMWYASYLIWQVNVSSSILVPLSNCIFGEDRTHQLALWGLNSTQLLGLFAIVWIILVTWISTYGISAIAKITSVGGIAVTLLNVILILGGALVLILNRGPQQHISFSAFFQSPNPSYQSFVSICSFFTYAIFAYGGIEAVGGLVDQTENAEKTFPKGTAFAAIIISIGYSIGIFAAGCATNWQDVLGQDNVTMANVAYIVMKNLGIQLGQVFGASPSVCAGLGSALARITGISMFCALGGAFFTLVYSPLKTLIEGAPKGLLPEKLTKTKGDLPVNAMWIQAIVVIAIILLVSFGGSAADAFFKTLVTMTNVAMTIPYMFLSVAFVSFKRKTSIHKPFEIYKSQGTALFASIVVTFFVGFANVFSIIEPAINGNWMDTVFSAGGPLLFAIFAWALYANYERKGLANTATEKSKN